MVFIHNSNLDAGEPAWSSVDKTKLPRMAFADQGEEGKKSTWSYPHHWVKDGGHEDEIGVYTTGTLLLHEGGWQAAMNAAHGARSGQQASPAVITHLETHRSAIEAYRQSKAQNEPLSLDDTEKCWANHMGIWCIEPMWMHQAVESIKSGMWKTQQDMYEIQQTEIYSAVQEKPQYDILQGVAVLHLHGPMMKAKSKFGGVSTVQLRQMLRHVAQNNDVQKVLLHIESPGGHVAGTHELATDIASFRLKDKPIAVHIEDLGASAAYWVASQADYITANAPAEIGSIGTVAILTDNSGRMNRLGIQTYVLSTGQFKGLGTEGVHISAEDLTYIQSRVDGLNTYFQQAVMQGRGISHEQMKAVSDGRVFLAEEAQSLKLIDQIMSFEQALEKITHLSTKEYNVRRAEVPQVPKRILRLAYSLDAFRYSKGV